MLSDFYKKIWLFYSIKISAINSEYAYGVKGNRMITLINRLSMLKAYSERLQKCLIMNRDYSFILKKFDSEKSFFFIDSPYRSTHKYVNANRNSEEIDYDKMEAGIKNLKGKFIMTHNYDNWIKTKFKDYRTVKLSCNRNVARYTTGSKKFTEKSNECMVMNF